MSKYKPRDLYFPSNIISSLIKGGFVGWTYKRDEIYTTFLSRISKEETTSKDIALIKRRGLMNVPMLWCE